MAGGKDRGKATEAAMSPEQASCLRNVENDMAPGKVPSSFNPSSLAYLPGNNISNVKPGDSSHKQGVEFGAYYPSNNTYGYVYPGYEGSYSRWNSQSYYVSQEGLTIPCSAPQLKPCSHQVSTSRRNQPFGKFSSPSYQGQRGQFARNIPANVGSNGRFLADSNKFLEREKVNLRRHSEGFSDVIRGPRANRKKASLISSDDKSCLNPLFQRDQYNLPDFETNYEQAIFYMIKSYNEDDVHKSIKYSVWASTPSGNKKLDDAFRDAEAKTKESGTKCPIFLFFSVNTSGQFVGVAEMTGPVDFKKSMDFWQEERWNGFFPVRWHIIKDTPNLEFRDIILENNDNRPVFFSRDTQEIRLPQGLQMLQIFKNYPIETAILDDFGFYDVREKALRAKRGCIPSLVCTEGEADRSCTSMRYLEAAMERVEVSGRPKKP